MSEKLVQLSTSQNLQRMRLAAVAVFALLCLFGFATFKNDTLDSANGEKLLAVNATDISTQEAVQKDKLVIEDKLEDALREENQSETQGKLGTDAQNNTEIQESADPQGNVGVQEGADPQDSVNVQESAAVQESTGSQGGADAQEDPGLQGGASAQESTGLQENTSVQTGSDSREQAGAQDAGIALGGQPESVDSVNGTEAETAGTGQQAAERTQATMAETAEAVVPEAVAYIIQPGDTLIAISRRQYGTDTRVQDICDRNKITDPNNIKQGQVIMLPQ